MSDLDLEAVFAEVSSPYVLLDRDLRMVWANSAYLNVTGRSKEQVIGRVMTEEFPAEPDSASDQMLRHSIARAFQTGETDHLPLIPYPIAEADGTLRTRYWSASHAPIRDKSGKVVYVLQNTNDVTDLYKNASVSADTLDGNKGDVLRRAEEVSMLNLELGSTTEFFQTIFEQAPGFMAVLVGKEHVFKVVNAAYYRLVGDRPLVGLSVKEALPDIEGQGFYELLDQVFQTGEPVAYSAAEVRLRMGNRGEEAVYYVDFVYQPLRNDAGEVIGIFLQGHDVTAQTMAEHKLSEAEERFRTMAQSMPSHVWTAQPDGQLDWLSDRLYQATGTQVGDLFGSDWLSVVHPDDLPNSAPAWLAAIKSGDNYETEFRIRAASGEYRWNIVRASPIRNSEGQIVRWVGTNTDIHDRKVAEAALADLNATLEQRVEQRNQELEEVHAALRQSQKMEAIGTLAGGVAHDFNNLLQAITGSLELASKDLPADSASGRRINQAMTAVDRGARLASQLLSFSRRQPLSPRPVVLPRLFADAEHILRSALGSGVELSIRSAPDLWTTLVDPANMENALLNLTVNARDAMEGMGTLIIEAENVHLDEAYARTHSDAEAGEYVMLTMTDTGPGMSQEVMDRAFEPFFSTKSEGRGTGLGLPMVYGFAKQSGGHIRLENSPGRGATVRVFLPRTELEVHETYPAERPEGVRGGDETVLLVEDDEMVRTTASAQLTALGYNVLEAPDADYGMRILESDAPIDLLLTDVVMPGRLTSREMAKRALKLRPGLPVLFSSGYTRDAMVHDGRLEEGVQLLSKPYSREALAHKLREMLDTAPEAYGRHGTQAGPEPNDAPTGAPKAAPTNGATPPRKAPANPPSHEGLRILVCEDDALICLDVAEMSAARGAKVQMASTGRDALKLLSQGETDVLLVDLGLPDMSGLQVARQAFEDDPAIAILFATGQHDLPEITEFSRAGMLTKPFTEGALLKEIDALISR